MFKTVESFMLADKRKNQTEMRDVTMMTMLFGGHVSDGLTERFVREARERKLADLQAGVISKKGLSPLSAREIALTLL